MICLFVSLTKHKRRIQMLKRKRKLTAMLLALAVLLGGLQQFTMPGVKAQAAAKTNVTAKSQAAADVRLYDFQLFNIK